jgi:hypothetical protein
MFAEIMRRIMSLSGKLKNSNSYRSYFVLDKSPNSDYIADERPGRRPNPAPLIDIVNLILKKGEVEKVASLCLLAAINIHQYTERNWTAFKQKKKRLLFFPQTLVVD